jgi:predicted ribosomally synthesized peptide with nif11-like leader
MSSPEKDGIPVHCIGTLLFEARGSKQAFMPSDSEFLNHSITSKIISLMSKKNVENLLSKGHSDKVFRAKYDAVVLEEQFVALANSEGFEFTLEDLRAVLRENGDVFESYGNPPKRGIWN